MIVAVRRLVTGLALFTLSGAATAAAQAPQTQAPPTQTPASASIRVAFVNAQAVLRGMPGYAKAESTWTKELQNAQVQGQKLQASMDSAVAAFQQSSAMLSPSARSSRQKALEAQNDSLQGKLQALQDKVEGRQKELLAPMQTRLGAILEGIRAEGNYWMIVDLGNPASQNIVAYDKSLDITERVVRRLLQSN
ncbi:MAG TPA: OmpH family outer membrane protein [Gemmatimonadales bacterium]|jgi:outer membrane protein|nr:OmpH family outer membrane protein [Gemmatimonadales bacterium]